MTEIRVGVVYGKFPSKDFVLEPCNIEDCDACDQHLVLKDWKMEAEAGGDDNRG